MIATPFEGEWEVCLELLDELKGRGLKPNIITYTAALNALARGRQPEKALALMDEVHDPDTVCYNGTRGWFILHHGCLF